MAAQTRRPAVVLHAAIISGSYERGTRHCDTFIDNLQCLLDMVLQLYASIHLGMRSKCSYVRAAKALLNAVGSASSASGMLNKQ